MSNLADFTPNLSQQASTEFRGCPFMARKLNNLDSQSSPLGPLPFANRKLIQPTPAYWFANQPALRRRDQYLGGST